MAVEGGGHYCVRLTEKFKSAVVAPIAVVDSQIEQVSCQQALKEASSYKEIDLKRVDPAVRGELVIPRASRMKIESRLQRSSCESPATRTFR